MSDIERKMNDAIKRRKEDEEFNTPPPGWIGPKNGNGKSNHVEAWCLMTYQGELSALGGVAPTREVIWNSRDGVTPFCITAKDSKEKLTHVNWRGDQAAPFYTPKVGDRVFVDLTPERAEEIARKMLKSIQESAKKGSETAKEHLEDIENQCVEAGEIEEKDPFSHWIMELKASYLSNKGAPDLIVVTKEWLEKFVYERNSRQLGYVKSRQTEMEEAKISMDKLNRETSSVPPSWKELGKAGSTVEGVKAKLEQAMIEAGMIAPLDQWTSAPPTEPLFEGPISIGALVKRALENSKAKGFYPTETAPDGSVKITTVNIPEKLLLISSEVTEAYDEARVIGRFPQDRYLDEKGKPCGFGSELADIIIRTAGLAGALGINLDTEIREKMQFNLTRPYQHGKKYEHGK